MVISEAVLAVTAYVLGLRRSYRLVRKIERRLLRSHPRTRSFVERRTRALFRFAAVIAKKVSKQDSALGRKLGNGLSRSSHQQQELHHDSRGRVVRGHGSKLNSCSSSSTSTSTSTSTSITAGIKNGKSTRSSDRRAGSKFGPGTHGEEGKKLGFCTLVPSARAVGCNEFPTLLETSSPEAGRAKGICVGTRSVSCVDGEEETSLAGPSDGISCADSCLPLSYTTQLTRLLSTVLSTLLSRAQCRMQQPPFFLLTTPIAEDESPVLASGASCSSSSSQVLFPLSPTWSSAMPSVCNDISRCSESQLASFLSMPSLFHIRSFSSVATFLASWLLDKKAETGEVGISSLNGHPNHSPSLDSMFSHGALNDPIRRVIPSSGSCENGAALLMRRTRTWNNLRTTEGSYTNCQKQSCRCDLVAKESNATSAGKGSESSNSNLVGSKRPLVSLTPQLIPASTERPLVSLTPELIAASHVFNSRHPCDVISFFHLMSLKGRRQDLLSLPWRPPSLARSFQSQPCFVSPSLRSTSPSSWRRLQ